MNKMWPSRSIRVMSVNSHLLMSNLGAEAMTCSPRERTETDGHRGDRQTGRPREEPVVMWIQLQLSAATLTTPHPSLRTQGTTGRFLSLPLAAFRFPHYWKLDTVICYWVCGLLRPSLNDKLKAGLFVISGIPLLWWTTEPHLRLAW